MEQTIKQPDYNTAQRTEQWHRQRLGKITSSMAYLFMGAKGVINTASAKYIDTKIMELLAGEAKEISAKSLSHGNDWEPVAKQYLANRHNSEYFEVEFLRHPELEYFGGSSDGFITISGIDTTPEIKCPVWEEAMVNRRLLLTVADCKKGWP